MFNGKKQSSFGPSSNQLESTTLPSLDPIIRLKIAMKKAISDSQLSREKIVSDMNVLAAQEGMTCGGKGQKVSLSILDKWISVSSATHVIPLRFLPLFCHVTNSFLPFNALISSLNAEVIAEEERKLLEWAKVEITRKKLKRDSKKLAQEVGL
ncbi:MAG: hypothetical protein HQM08_17255 [Candidatus Riflebacteria bacterium]|nr:hypothetical protein [Candidatus Riflebacteria bacterium]